MVKARSSASRTAAGSRWAAGTLGMLLAACTPLSLLGSELPACGRCGCQQPLETVCRLVCELQEVKETKYKLITEQRCLPKLGQRCGCQYVPACGQSRTVRKLVKYEEIRQVPTYRCIEELLCWFCRSAD